MIEIEPDFYGAYWLKGAIRLTEGRYADAVEELKRAVSLGGHHIVVADLASAYGLAARREDAAILLDQLLESAAANTCPPSAWRVCTAGSERREAIEWLETAFDERNGEWCFCRGRLPAPPKTIRSPARRRTQSERSVAEDEPAAMNDSQTKQGESHGRVSGRTRNSRGSAALREGMRTHKVDGLKGGFHQQANCAAISATTDRGADRGLGQRGRVRIGPVETGEVFDCSILAIAVTGRVATATVRKRATKAASSTTSSPEGQRRWGS